MKNAMIAATKRPIDFSHSIYRDCSLLALPSLPVFCGALSSDLSLFDNQNFQFIDRPEILAQASRIAALLKDTDVSYLSSGFIKKQSHHNLPSEGKTLEEKVKTAVLEEGFSKGPQHQSDGLINVCNSCLTLLYA
ncbi:hypothetical protein AMTRI_Chr10g225230 [Amborella trichopoda]